MDGYLNCKSLKRHSAFFLLVLKHEKRISFEITHVYFRAELLDVGMFLTHEPAHVREEETSACVMGVGVRVCEFMVNTMIANPLDDAVLEGHRLEEHEKIFKFSVCFVGTVSPETMCSCCNPKASKETNDNGCK